jgi:SulP family sulfate permease
MKTDRAAPTPPSEHEPRSDGAGTIGARIARTLMSSLVITTMTVSFGISLAALVFSGDLAPYLPAGIGVLLCSSFIVGLTVALRSSFKAALSAPQDNTTVIIAAIAAGVGRMIPHGSDALPTIVAAFAVTSLLTGAVCLALGMLRLGMIVRFVPYPVVGGFIACTGWLVVQGALSVLTGVNLTIHNLDVLLVPGDLINWVPGTAFGIFLALALRRWSNSLVLPGLIACGIVIFYLALGVAGIGVEEASARGWLLGPFPKGGLWPPLQLPALAEIARGHVHWAAIWANIGGMGTLTVLMVISVLLNASGLELATGTDIDLDRELRINGFANIASGAFGGVPGHLLLGDSALNMKLGGKNRYAGAISSVLVLLMLMVGTTLLSYFPKPILGGLLCCIGLLFLLETVYDARSRLPRLEYSVVLVILAVVVASGFFEGLLAGLVFSSGLFAVNYARISVVKHEITGAFLRSKAARTAEDESLLQQFGDQICIMQLQGYIFFGTAHSLVQRVYQRMLGREGPQAKYVLLDFRYVDGIDSSSALSFTRLRKLARKLGVRIAFTQLSTTVRTQLERSGGLDAPAADKRRAPPPSPSSLAPIHIFADLDRGLEWCEGQLLLHTTSSRVSSEAISELWALARHKKLVDELAPYLERIEVNKGAEIFKKGAAASDLILIESGELAAWLDVDDGRSIRLRSMGAGSVVGESGLYLGQPRSATVRATCASVLHRLTQHELDRMTVEAPELAADFHQLVVTILAERVVNTTTAAQMAFF